MTEFKYSESLLRLAKFRSFFVIWGLLLAFFWIFRIVVTMPDIVSVVLSLMWLLYVPLSIANLFLNIPIHSFRHVNRFLNSLNIRGAIIKWFMGLIIVTLLSFVLSFVFSNNAGVSGSLLLLVTVAAHLIPHVQNPTIRITRNHLYLVFLISVLSFAFGFYVRSYSPYPLTPGLDLFSHMWVIKSFLENSLFASPLLYAPVFHAMIGLSSVTYGASIFGIFWLGPLLLFQIFGISLFLLSRQTI